MAEYIKQEMCDLNGTGEKPVYYRMKIQRNMDMEDFVERITYPGSGLSRGSVIQVMTTVAEHLAYCMAEGQSVTLDGIGTFTPRLGVAKDKEIDLQKAAAAKIPSSPAEEPSVSSPDAQREGTLPPIRADHKDYFSTTGIVRANASKICLILWNARSAISTSASMSSKPSR